MAAKLNIRVHGLTDTGLVRHQNEDALYVNEHQGIFAVADGLGGLPGGADASHRIVELLGQTFQQVDHENERVDLADLIVGIHRIILKESNEAHPFTGSGSTLTIGQILEDTFYIAHVGDSAAFRLRDDDFQKLTIDHTMEQEVIDRLGERVRGSIPPEYPHTLTRCVGQEEELLVDHTRTDVAPGDRLLLCTDGLSKVLPEKLIKEHLSEGTDPRAICEDLLRCANANDGPDNITIIVVLMDGAIS